jgi:DNA-binding MarR family transcriptional regulator
VVDAEALYPVVLEMRLLAATAAKAARQSFEHRLEASGVPVGVLPYGVMHLLSAQEQTISELSRTMNLRPATLVPVVDALEGRGLVRRGHDPNDRRRVPLSLTERGAAMVASVPLIDEDDALARSLSAMGAERSGQLLLLLRDLVRHMPQGEDLLRQVSARVRAQDGSPIGQ